MSYKEFWEDNPYLAVVYRKRHRLLCEEKNQQMWLQGLYNLLALRSVISGFFSKGNPEPYCENPLPIFKTSDESKKTQEEQIDDIVATLNQLSAMYPKSDEK